MNKRLIGKLLMVSSIAGASYYYGAHIERQRLQTNFEKFTQCDPYLFCNKDDLWSNVQSKPGLPIFSTVSAAVPAPIDEPKNLTAIPTRISQIMRFGFPGLDHVRSYSDYVLSYDRRNRIPHWVFEHITQQAIQPNDAVDRSKCEFRRDESIHLYFRSENTDYRNSGFDRGHMAAAGNHRLHQKHCDDTFFLTNIAPQVGQGFNRDSWNRLESHVRKLTKVYPNVYVCTGPLFLPRKEDDGKNYIKYQVIGNNNVAVPTHFYKIVVGETADSHLEMEAYVMPNKEISNDTPLQVFQVPLESIERAAGLLFFDGINRKQLTKINGKKV